MSVIQKIFALFIFVFFCLSSCIIGGGGAGSSRVDVRVVAFHSNSLIRTGSGQPYIRRQASREICRWRPFELETVRDQLLTQGIDEDILDDYIFPIDEEAEEEEESSLDPVVKKPIYVETAENWTKFGLQIVNTSNYLLIIDTIRLNAKARCGSQVFEHSSELSSGYCAGDSEAPYLYIVPPAPINAEGRPSGPMINYHPRSTNAFDNLTLIFDAFPIIDRTGEASTNFQNLFKSSGQNTFSGSVTGGGAEAGLTNEQECSPNQIIVVPRYDVELTLVGYFLLPSGAAEQVGHFSKRIRFPITSINF